MVEIKELVVSRDDDAAKICSNCFSDYSGSSLPSSSNTSPACNSNDDYCLLRELLLREVHPDHGLLFEPLPGGAPSLAESESALRELQSVLVQKSPDTCADKFVERTRMTDSAGRKREADSRDKACIYPFTQSPWKIARRHDNNIVHLAADLLQHDPKLKAAAVSLSSDPAVWDACSKNKSFQELIHSMNNGYSQPDAIHRIGTHLCQERENPFLMALRSVKNLFWDVVEAVNGAFGSIDRWLFGEPDNDSLDRPIKTGIVLAMLLLALVVLRRKP